MIIIITNLIILGEIVEKKHLHAWFEDHKQFHISPAIFLFTINRRFGDVLLPYMIRIKLNDHENINNNNNNNNKNRNNNKTNNNNNNIKKHDWCYGSLRLTNNNNNNSNNNNKNNNNNNNTIRRATLKPIRLVGDLCLAVSRRCKWLSGLSVEVLL